MKEKVYTIEVAGVTRHLPIMQVSPKLAIASFVILGDVEIVNAASSQLVKKMPQVDWLITAEAKGIPLVHQIASLLSMKRYIVARKSIKPYMSTPLISEVNSITTQKKQMLYLDGHDVEIIRGKRVAIVDDVISTGESIAAVEKLVRAAGGIVSAKVAILAEGDAAERDDIIFLEKLPLFPIE
ncbi:adenine/guanine phosphoribosyltransferases and like PRPP-binding protein [Gottschalkia purinilytica]|uniref:Adenine/guanine phosphoribosyltransferases and like PRPP-binding protein n=2 Tax=Gottschalkia purinilytica TaxID=1503 RepID=A0A0L0WF44_GOTPU|nr:adenine/guanine phosphoribosyltransferases and like PRPP-binding protein [Gottschalkia purinilytica]